MFTSFSDGWGVWLALATRRSWNNLKQPDYPAECDSSKSATISASRAVWLSIYPKNS
jgi:hypothetical protein